MKKRQEKQSENIEINFLKPRDTAPGRDKVKTKLGKSGNAKSKFAF